VALTPSPHFETTATIATIAGIAKPQLLGLDVCLDPQQLQKLQEFPRQPDWPGSGPHTVSTRKSRPFRRFPKNARSQIYRRFTKSPSFVTYALNNNWCIFIDKHADHEHLTSQRTPNCLARHRHPVGFDHVAGVASPSKRNPLANCQYLRIGRSSSKTHRPPSLLMRALASSSWACLWATLTVDAATLTTRWRWRIPSAGSPSSLRSRSPLPGSGS